MARRTRRDRGDGSIDARGPNTWRLRYRVGHQRFSEAFHGSLADARKELRAKLKEGDDRTHIAPNKITVGQWIERWLGLGAPGRRKRRVGRRTLERYGELLRCHVVPTLGMGARPLQQLEATEIDSLYVKLEGRVSPRTAHHVHTVFGACLAAAVRTRLLRTSPLAHVEKVPSPGESDHGIVLEEEQLRTLVNGFRSSVLFPIVAVAAFTGARRNEILALRWSDLNIVEKTLRIERAVEQVRKQPLTLKEPKTARQAHDHDRRRPPRYPHRRAREAPAHRGGRP
jgi:integrase